ncbi:MAG TPA: hypothetical protein DDX39_02205 [Bacteroidales bacterium]|nr:MAG: hypothetical protein A2W98_08825 [Bacteroidetes bacterium GWF2_33_38]OFY73847.1 MAG: hypothetical protein A2265_02555 [Bacteroidetes bacterium RIFOXYA12_FULL_33_9]HBF87427.1 hypothetical protein [Bacteroidales bacterium]
MALFFENEIDFNIASKQTVSYEKSDAKWSLYLKDITLKQNFDGLLPQIFNPNNEIYLYVICWDYSGNAPIIYPLNDIDPASLIIRIKKNKVHKFNGDGVLLWPRSYVHGALHINITLIEDDKDIVKRGETLMEISKAINKSKLFELTSAISSNPATITGVAVAKAITEISRVIGSIMSKNKNDYINLFQGCFGVENHNTPEKKNYPFANQQAEMNLEFIVN